MINPVITIAEVTTPAGRPVLWDGQLSHHIPEDEVQAALKDTATNLWKSSQAAGIRLGAALFRFLDGTGGRLREIIRQAYHGAVPVSLYLDLPESLTALPFELIYDDQTQSWPLLDDQRSVSILRRVNDRGSRKEFPPANRSLRVLFTACSPMELDKHEILGFEKEEEIILQAVKKFPVDLTIDDSGSPAGLGDKLIEGGEDHYDIVHITGHAGIDKKLGPVFYMEDEFGREALITPEALWEALKDYPPRLLFLSGCDTGAGDVGLGAQSFAHQMVDRGVPHVLGWGLSVNDDTASILAMALYEALGKGKDVTAAVRAARQGMKQYHTWPLLRLFTDGSPLKPLIKSGQPLRYVTARGMKYRYLTGSQVKVLEQGFIGRR
ncbi:MAG: CHAT domain-containing protein, partial [Deltaproteobacteria bacterium]|nr:CHAT domain-containing protein [Deltaproteobacteria bacterium]